MWKTYVLIIGGFCLGLSIHHGLYRNFSETHPLLSVTDVPIRAMHSRISTNEQLKLTGVIESSDNEEQRLLLSVQDVLGKRQLVRVTLAEGYNIVFRTEVERDGVIYGSEETNPKKRSLNIGSEVSVRLDLVDTELTTRTVTTTK